MLKVGAAAGAGALTTSGLAGEGLELEQGSNARAQTRANKVKVNVSKNELRERLSLDCGWRFALGHACDPMRDFGFGK
jgi:beta-galactosidase